MGYDARPVLRLIAEKLEEAIKEKDWSKVESILREIKNIS